MYAIFVDLTEAIEDIYPGLSISEVETIAKDIHQSWDYSSIYDEVVEQIDVVANNNQINLEGKDGIQTSDEVLGYADGEEYTTKGSTKVEIYDDQNDPYGGH